MSAYIPDDWLPPAKLTVRVKGKKVVKEVKSFFFTSAPGPNSDNLNLIFTDGSVEQVDLQFIRDNKQKNKK